MLNQIVLYSISNIGLPVDGKVAYLIESFEPLAEIIKYKTEYLQSLKSRDKCLKNYIRGVIEQYGEDIFFAERSKNFDKFLELLVNTRVNIMHIRAFKKSPNLSGAESALYIAKIALLYRCIMFDLLDIDKALYMEKLDQVVNILNDWNNILEGVLNKLIK